MILREVVVDTVTGHEVSGRLLPDIIAPLLGPLFRRDLGVEDGGRVTFPVETVRRVESAGTWRECQECGAGLSNQWAICSCGHQYGSQCSASYEYLGDWPGQYKSARCCLVEGHAGDHNGWNS